VNLRWLRSPFTVMLFFVPLGWAFAHQGADVNPLLVFAINGLAIVPLADLISRSVDQMVEHLGDQWAGCLNATLGNTVELVVAYSALTGGLYEIAVDGLVGGLVTNLLLVLGIAAVLGGLRHRRMQIKAGTALLNSKLLMAVMMVAFVPSVLMHLRMFPSMEHHLKYSVVMAVTLLIFYALSYVYQFFTHGELFREMPLPFDQQFEGDQHSRTTNLPGESTASGFLLSNQLKTFVSAFIVLGLTTVALIFTSQALVDGLAQSVARFKLNSFFSGVFLLPLFGSAAEFVVSIRAARSNRMELAVATTVGSSIQIVLFVLPLLILIGAAIGKPLGIFFAPEAMVSIIVSVFAVQWVTEDGSLDWFEGAFLIMIYLLLLVSSFFLL
jgi:Ca2+:H+ antiporter